MLNIGQASAASGVSSKMIRHYEELGLLPAAKRTDAGYRQYDDAAVQALKFVRHSRDLGFSTDQIRALLGLWHDRARPSREVRALAQAHLDELDQKIREIQAMKSTLESLVHCCHGDDRPECPIIESLADPAADAAPRARMRASHRAGERMGHGTGAEQGTETGTVQGARRSPRVQSAMKVSA